MNVTPQDLDRWAEDNQHLVLDQPKPILPPRVVKTEAPETSNEITLRHN